MIINIFKCVKYFTFIFLILATILNMIIYFYLINLQEDFYRENNIFLNWDNAPIVKISPSLYNEECADSN